MTRFKGIDVQPLDWLFYVSDVFELDIGEESEHDDGQPSEFIPVF